MFVCLCKSMHSGRVVCSSKQGPVSTEGAKFSDVSQPLSIPKAKSAAWQAASAKDRLHSQSPFRIFAA